MDRRFTFVKNYLNRKRGNFPPMEPTSKASRSLALTRQLSALLARLALLFKGEELISLLPFFLFPPNCNTPTEILQEAAN